MSAPASNIVNINISILIDEGNKLEVGPKGLEIGVQSFPQTSCPHTIMVMMIDYQEVGL